MFGRDQIRDASPLLTVTCFRFGPRLREFSLPATVLLFARMMHWMPTASNHCNPPTSRQAPLILGASSSHHRGTASRARLVSAESDTSGLTGYWPVLFL